MASTMNSRIMKALQSILVAGGQIEVTSSSGRGGHRHPKALIGGKLHVKLPQLAGALCCVGVEVPVAEMPEVALEKKLAEDETYCGCPHHWQLSEDKTKLQYMRHGTSAWNTETGSRYLEAEEETFILWENIYEEDLLDVDEYIDTYHERVAKTVKITVNALKALAY